MHDGRWVPYIVKTGRVVSTRSPRVMYLRGQLRRSFNVQVSKLGRYVCVSRRRYGSIQRLSMCC